jgi:tRNA A-37 threonylcarbamoyl transferase component Bud32
MVVGELIADRYELEELVGTGGMSDVFRAHDQLLDRKVALKVLHQQFTADEEYVERFRREARSVAQLSHPNIVTVIDRGEADGRQFIVFEYVDGENLKTVVNSNGAMPVETAVSLAHQIARALAFAHENGLVHRDVKPQNVLLNGDGRAKVTDFGIARSMDVKHGMTQTGTVLGTSDYIAPEQAQGQQVSAQTDVYSLGVVLYELLTGEVPFPGENFVAVAMRHINEPAPSARERRRDVPPRLDAALQRAMAKDPRDRFSSMDAFCAELAACLQELNRGVDPDATLYAAPSLPPPVASPPAARRPRRALRRPGATPVAVFLVGLLAAAAIAAAIVAWRNSQNHHASTPPVSAATLVPVHAIAGYDPYGNNRQENNAAAPLATDGNPATAWTTERYYDHPRLNKQGVGLLLDAGKQVTLSRIGISTSMPGFIAQIKAGDSPTGPFHDVSASKTVGGTTWIDLQHATARYFVIWITRLGSYASANVNEVRAVR